MIYMGASSKWASWVRDMAVIMSEQATSALQLCQWGLCGSQWQLAIVPLHPAMAAHGCNRWRWRQKGQLWRRLEVDYMTVSHRKILINTLWSHFMCTHLLQPRLTLYDPMDCSPPASSLHGILRARILEWIAMSSSRGSSRLRDRIHVSWSFCVAGGFFTEQSGEPYTYVCVYVCICMCIHTYIYICIYMHIGLAKVWVFP